MRLLIQIPCYNEEKNISNVLGGLPKHIAGITSIETQIIDDGCTDTTVAIAKSLGISRFISIPKPNKKWLGRAFKKGVEAALFDDFDILVNTDGDNQYPGDFIPALVLPIIEEQADIVIGDRHLELSEEISPIKQQIQLFGNRILSLFMGQNIRDSVSGFRAFNKDALLALNITNKFSYTTETLIQAYEKGLRVAWIEIKVNPPTRPSRLSSSTSEMLYRTVKDIVRVLAIYRGTKILFLAGALFIVPGLILLARFFYFYFFQHHEATGHIQSVIVGASSLTIGTILLFLSFFAELVLTNRKLLEELLIREKRK